MDDNRFGLFIKAKRLELNLTLRQAAEKVKMSHSHLLNLENGVHSNNGKKIKLAPDKIKLISEGYNLDYNYLLLLAGYIDDPNDISISSNESNDLEFIISEFSHRVCTNNSLTISGVPLTASDLNFLRVILKTSVESLKDLKINELKDKKNSK
ncbi:MAG: helix-turn-helix domain-containing protein [Clostridium sp.]